MNGKTMTETYRDMESLIYHLANPFCRDHRSIPQDEALSVLRITFTEAYRSYDPKKGASFSTWFQWLGTKRLLNLLKKKIETVPIEVDVVDPCSSCFLDFIDELSEDAQIVVGLVLETPKELLRLIRDEWHPKRKTRDNLRRYLVGLGWSIDRVKESFGEIRRALG